MSNAACKAIICDDEAQGRMTAACQKIYHLKEGASTELRIKHSEIYIKYMDEAKAAADKLVFDSGQ